MELLCFVLIIIIIIILRWKKKINIDVEIQNKIIEEKNKEVSIQAAELNALINSLNEKKDFINNEISTLGLQRVDMITENQLLSAQFEANRKKANDAFEDSVNALKENLELWKDKILKEYQESQEDYQKEYLKVIKDFSEISMQKAAEIGILESQINELRSKANAAREERKRNYENSQKINFYKMILSKEDIDEIKHLRSITPYLRNSEPLNKVIWKVYYENPCSDLLGRVLGKEIHTGIYKITNLETGMCYVGQAVDVASRWKQHIKRGIGAEAPTKNKLYPAMLEYGVENFSFELIEECDKDSLNEREQYWQDFFGAKEFGYSIK